MGKDNTFSFDEFELVQLFAAQVSIALQNAEVFQAVQIRARTDGLTGLLNHGTFEEWLNRTVREGNRFSLIMLDLDDFREVNNELGHQAGDEQLRRVAAELVRAGRDSDVVFRYGGDEFVFLLPNTGGEGALQVAERARLAVRATGGNMSASIGVATFPVDGSTATEILLAADRACFVVKRAGRDRIATAAQGLALGAELSLQEPNAGRSDRSRGGLTPRSMRVPPAPCDSPASSWLRWPACPARDARRSVRRRGDRFRGARRDTGALGQPTGGPTPIPSFVRPTPLPAPTFLVYTVRSGDTLTSIARAFQTTPRSIAFWSRGEHPSLDPESTAYNPDRLEIGWILLLVPNAVFDESELPDRTPAATAAPSPPPARAPPPAER